ncbi:MAG: MFS transporter [Parcubacteria group bacterium]|nr:MFS transporter [Parcubacteria group bacterium]
MALANLTFDADGVPIHSQAYRFRRFLNWFPLGLGYASLMFMRYNLNPAKSALGDKLMDIKEFGFIFGMGAFFYFIGFMINGPLVDRKGGRWGMLTGVTGAMVANLLMALSIYGVMVLKWNISLFWTLLILYAVNMFFQSLGAMSIVTTKMPWFHVRERGTFGFIFGVMISLGIYFAFDWGYAIRSATRAVVDVSGLGITSGLFQSLLHSGNTGVDQNWWMFLFPALFAVPWLIWMFLFLRNTPSDTGKFQDFDPGDEQVAERALSLREMLNKIFRDPQHRVLLIICAIEFCSGVVRNGVFQYYPQFAESVGFKKDFFLTANWGLCLMICGIAGGFMTGWISDKFFGSRRGPMVMILYAFMTVAMFMILLSLGGNAPGVGSMVTAIGVLIIATAIIGVHGILSGTAAGDFSGTKNTGKAVGIVDGCVYVGTGIHSVIMGFFLSTGDAAKDPSTWISWPMVIIPFVIIGGLLSLKIYHSFPNSGRAH